ncbi:ExeM/NucH family extracellular endonuclease [Hymenobacter persicinus]|uniref:ExeM/NucH family extracellular endonuclease n=1 Tax=Hymenobacter persicinus TaxID=2025506 RepID=A0A4Q5LDR4_9BACT|nr:ExeM/NucH family extracellular endonuclease [Hymenobacter persicinus]RYU81880.1 ExeM/NucH family extracellular endonuclease [Hymenobacter persicinus]
MSRSLPTLPTTLLALCLLTPLRPCLAQAAEPVEAANAAGVTRIGTIQGAGAAARPGTYTIEAIVTGVYSDLNPAGFYVQEMASASDGNPATSDALFVVQPSPIVNIGDKVRVTGTVQESAVEPSFDQAVLTQAQVQVLSSGNELPSFVQLSATSFTGPAMERYEGMRIQLPVPLTVSEVYNLQQRGELTLTIGGVTYQPTQFIDPNDNPATGTASTGTSNVAAISAYQDANTERSLLLDDGSSATKPKLVPYLNPAMGTIRVGSKVAKLRGILGYGFNKWRVQPLPGADAPVFNVVRPGVPTFGRSDLKLVSFNVLNYFNGDGAGGGFPTARGAKTAADFARQRSKIIAALAQMDADVIGLTEIENDGTGPNSALADLVGGLNQVLGANTYTFVDDGGPTQQPNNTDAIHCAILYKPTAVRPLGPALVAPVTGVFERPPLAQLFATRRKARPDTLALVINHFKSKSSGSGLNADLNDGQGGSNERRRNQANALVQFINTTVIPAGATRVVSIGDYNANYEEDPIDIMRAAGLVVVTPPTSASYVFKGLTGSLDHCVVTSNMVGFIDVHKWNINSAEPYFLEYGMAGPATAVNSPFRSSDHDPVLISVNFSGMTPANVAAPRLYVYPNQADGAHLFNLTGVPASAGPLTLEVLLPQGPPMLQLRGPVALLQSELSRNTAHLAPGIYLLRLKGRNFAQTQRVMKE